MEEPPEVGQWKRISVLGSGSFGVVILWQNTTSSDYIAVKKCKLTSGTQLTQRQRKRWENEVAIMKSLHCLNIISFKPLPFELEVVLLKHNPTKLPLLSMEYSEKGNLRHYLNQIKNASGLPEPEVRHFLRDVTQAISHLHTLKITHRDIKPENIVLGVCDTRPEGIIYKIIDLGYAKELSDTIVSFVGTLHYIAPEIMMTETYNFCVDYWSFGIVAFEVVCGILPFLPQFTPTQRFNYIEKKGPEHICIYQLHSGSVCHSSELLKENHISTCLKQNLEIWLQHVLQFDPKLRETNFPNNVGVFDFLLNILDKKIVQVFSVYTLEYYSYEINDSTLIGTLQDWIARDTKVKRSDQILIIGKNIDFNEDKCIMDVLPNATTTMFVFKMGAFIHRETFILPKYVKVLFENISTKYGWRELRLIYIKSLFFLMQEEKLIEALLTAFDLYNCYLQCLNGKLKNNLRATHKIVTTLVGRVDCYHNIHNNNYNKTDINGGQAYKSCLQQFQQLITELEKSILDTNTFIKNIQVLVQRQAILDNAFDKVSPVIKQCDMTSHVNHACDVINKGGGQGRDLSCKEMVKVISNALKTKDKLLNNKNFRNYAKAISIGVHDAQYFLNIIESAHRGVMELFGKIDHNQKEQYRILLVSDKPQSTVTLTGSCLNDFTHTDDVVRENQDLRCQFEDVLIQMLIQHRRICDEM